MNTTNEHRAVTGMAAYLRDYRAYWQAADRWGEDTAAIILHERYGDAFLVEDVKIAQRMVRYHVEHNVNASASFQFADAMATGSNDILARAFALGKVDA